MHRKVILVKEIGHFQTKFLIAPRMVLDCVCMCVLTAAIKSSYPVYRWPTSGIVVAYFAPSEPTMSAKNAGTLY